MKEGIGRILVGILFVLVSLSDRWMLLGRGPQARIVVNPSRTRIVVCDSGTVGSHVHLRICPLNVTVLHIVLKIVCVVLTENS